MSHYDLLVLGAGSGGLAASKRAASYGKKVAVIENDKVGGTCVIRGCVPKKIMSFAGQINEVMEDAKGYGFKGEVPELDFTEFAAKRNAEIDRLNNLHISFLEKAGVELILGHGKFVDEKTIDVDGKHYTADHIIIATGGRPTIPNGIRGTEHAITSDGIWELTERPEHIVINGGGYIALEFASIFNAMGSEVHVVIRKDLVLRGFDKDIRESLQEEMAKRGVIFHTKCNIQSIQKTEETLYEVQLDNGETLQTNQTIFATGRTPNSDTISIEATGITPLENGAIEVNDKMQTSQANVYAIGDIVNRVNLTPVAIKHGRMVADNLFNNCDLTVDDESPSAIFTIPPVGTAGIGEEEASEKFGKDDVEVFYSKFRPMFYVLAERQEKNMLKMVVQKSTQKVLGCHMVGKDAPEIIQGFAVAIRMGATKDQFDATVAIHPSSAEEFVLMR